MLCRGTHLGTPNRKGVLAVSIDRVKVWDPSVRLFHWSLVAAFFIAYFVEPEGSGLAVHVWAGYFVGGIVILRVVWGFVGTNHARFSDFAFGPFQALRYLVGLLRGKTPRYIGHSPAGAWMVYVLLLVLAAIVYTGISVLAMEEHSGPLASLYVSSVTPGKISDTARQQLPAAAGKERNEEHEGGSQSAESFMEEAHEVLANVTLILVGLHIAGVLLASFVHRENLVGAMVTGYKRPDHDAKRHKADSMSPSSGS